MSQWFNSMLVLATASSVSAGAFTAAGFLVWAVMFTVLAVLPVFLARKPLA